MFGSQFLAGYLKKSGDISQNHVNKGIAVANLRSGTIGIKVRILRKDVRLPDQIIAKETIAPEQPLTIKEEPTPLEEIVLEREAIQEFDAGC